MWLLNEESSIPGEFVPRAAPQDRARESKASRPSTPREVQSHGTVVLDTWSLRGYAVPPGDATEVDVSPVVGRVCAALVMEADAIWEYREHSVSRTRQRTTNRASRNGDDDDDDDKPDAPIPAGTSAVATTCKTPLERFKVQRSSFARFFCRRASDERSSREDRRGSPARIAPPRSMLASRNTRRSSSEQTPRA